ncbi:MAG: hypothetical protein KKE24_07805 [Candidatus Thermoplasmatota archaeon]|nr:hypothetical protein [Candidatus Thermoplasmatota archaeon]
MDDLSDRARLPSKKALENYSSAYIGAYMNAVEREKPEHVPSLARNSPYEIEACMMPNHSFVMLFERADKQSIIVHEKDWHYVESKVMSGVSHLVTVYAHEGPTVADAIAKGKKDAVRDIRALEDSNVAKAIVQLEKILEELSNIEKGNKSILKIADMQLSKLQPIKNAIRNAGPEIDMVGMIDALRNYPTTPVEINIDLKEKELLESICRDLGDLSDIIRRVEVQDQKVEQLEQAITKGLTEFHTVVDEKVGKGLAVVLSSSDRKIDKGFDELQNQINSLKTENVPTDLEDRLKGLEDALLDLKDRPDVAKEIVLAVADIRDNINRMNGRVTKIEQFLVHLTKHRVAPKQ